MLLQFAALQRPVWLAPRAVDLLEPLSRIASGWTCRRVEDDAHGPPRADVRVDHDGSRYLISAPWLDDPIEELTPERAAGNLAVDLIEAYLDERPERLSLHCGAALLSGRLVIFPSRSQGGKSTLMASLAAAGIPVFCDDVLPLSGPQDGVGVALGVAPRLRLPLPASSPPGLLALAADRGMLAGTGYTYLDLPGAVRCPLGTEAPLGAIVLLDRGHQGPARLEVAATGDGLHELILQNLSHHARAGEVLQRLHPLTQRLPCFRLRYTDLGEATDLLTEHFSVPAAFHYQPEAPPPNDHPDEPDPEPIDRSSAETRVFTRMPGITGFPTQGGLFLTDAQGREVFRLDALGAGIWKLLDAPLSRSDAVFVLRTAFPDVDARQIRTDVIRFFDALQARGLLRAREAARPPL